MHRVVYPLVGAHSGPAFNFTAIFFLGWDLLPNMSSKKFSHNHWQILDGAEYAGGLHII